MAAALRRVAMWCPRVSVCAQFDADCRPFTVAGFNAHHLVTNVLVLPHNHKTPGARPGAAPVPTPALYIILMHRHRTWRVEFLFKTSSLSVIEYLFPDGIFQCRTGSSHLS